MSKYRFNMIVTKHHVEWKKFCCLEPPQRLCKFCGNKIHDGQPNFADECVSCWYNRTGGLSEYDFDIAIHINCDHDETGSYGYEYDIACSYT